MVRVMSERVEGVKVMQEAVGDNAVYGRLND